jgi:predicted DCC family thiol-disulfide oxidoreductase YuxK
VKLPAALGRQVLKELGLPDSTLDRTILLLDGDEVFTRSAAVLRALRDPLYDLVARNRYRWFGRRDACFVPTAATRDRFIDL